MFASNRFIGFISPYNALDCLSCRLAFLSLHVVNITRQQKNIYFLLNEWLLVFLTNFAVLILNSLT